MKGISPSDSLELNEKVDNLNKLFGRVLNNPFLSAVLCPLNDPTGTAFLQQFVLLIFRLIFLFYKIQDTQKEMNIKFTKYERMIMCFQLL